MSISGTSLRLQLIGGATIGLGVDRRTATGYLQARLNRAQLLQPAAALIEQVDETKKRLDGCPDSLRHQMPQTALCSAAVSPNAHCN